MAHIKYSYPLQISDSVTHFFFVEEPIIILSKEISLHVMRFRTTGNSMRGRILNILKGKFLS